jgi:hypothetical protein
VVSRAATFCAKCFRTLRQSNDQGPRMDSPATRQNCTIILRATSAVVSEEFNRPGWKQESALCRSEQFRPQSPIPWGNCATRQQRDLHLQGAGRSGFCHSERRPNTASSWRAVSVVKIGASGVDACPRVPPCSMRGLGTKQDKNENDQFAE